MGKGEAQTVMRVLYLFLAYRQRAPDNTHPQLNNQVWTHKGDYYHILMESVYKSKP